MYYFIPKLDIEIQKKTTRRGAEGAVTEAVWLVLFGPGSYARESLDNTEGSIVVPTASASPQFSMPLRHLITSNSTYQEAT